jgi:hypothetical protein
MLKKFILSITIVVGITLQSIAQAPKYSNEFLNVGVGARAT